jgi:hypothetical protein
MKVAQNTTERIKEYLQKNLSKGYTLDALRISLINTQGYSPSIVDKAIKSFNDDLAKKAPILEDKPKIVHHLIDEKDNVIEVNKNSFWRRLFRLNKE